MLESESSLKIRTGASTRTRRYGVYEYMIRFKVSLLMSRICDILHFVHCNTIATASCASSHHTSFSYPRTPSSYKQKPTTPTTLPETKLLPSASALISSFIHPSHHPPSTQRIVSHPTNTEQERRNSTPQRIATLPRIVRSFAVCISGALRRLKVVVDISWQRGWGRSRLYRKR